MRRRVHIIAASSLAAMLLGGCTLTEEAASTGEPISTTSEEMADAKDTVRQAANVVQRLRTDPDTRETLLRAEAVFIMPNYGKAALGIGGAGGEGALFTNTNGQWSGPAFYNVGSISVGFQAGVEGGTVALFLMTEDALENFEQENNFTISGDAGLTVVNWSKRKTVSSAGEPDVIAWSDTKGLLGDLAVSIDDIIWDDRENRAYYQKAVSASDIMNGRVQPAEPDQNLQSEFSALEREKAGEPKQ